MAARSIGSGTMSFGLVTIPFKIYTAVSAQTVSFNMLHKDCGSRLKQQLLCQAENKVVERTDTVKGFEYGRDQYVQFSEEELKGMEAKQNGGLVLEEFVPATAVDRLHIEKTYFIGPDKGAERSYQLLSHVLAKKEALAIGRFAQRGKDNLVAIGAYKRGLVLHQCYYATEIRAFEDVEIGGTCAFNETELKLATALIDQLWREDFDASRFRDEWVEAVKAAVDKKIAGEELVAIVTGPKVNIVDLLEALQRSVAANESKAGDTGPKKAAPRAAKKRARELER